MSNQRQMKYFMSDYWDNVQVVKEAQKLSIFKAFRSRSIR